MEITELRIGNVIRHNVENTESETGFCEPNEDKISEDDMNIFLITDQFKNAEPVRLTEDWLKRFGFSDKKPGFIGVDVGSSDFVLTKPHETWTAFSFEFKYGGWARFKNFEFVHELQNFFFALTGTELVLQERGEKI